MRRRYPETAELKRVPELLVAYGSCVGGHTSDSRRRSDRAALAAAAARGRLQWRDAAARERSRGAIDAIVGPVAGRDALARSHLAETEAREEFIRRPWMNAGIPVAGAAHLRAASAAGRGVLVSYCHFGPFPGIGATVAEHVGGAHQVVGAWLTERPPDEREQHRRQGWLSMFEAADVTLVSATGCFPVVSDLLARGAVVVISFDWPGSARTSFLGKPVQLASGTARLAAVTGALIVPVARHFRRLRPGAVFGPPIDPRDHHGWRSIQDALAACHGHSILGRPAALEDPRRPGAWGTAATAAGWGEAS